MLPHSDQMMTLASSSVFVLEYPEHLISTQLRGLVDKLMA